MSNYIKNKSKEHKVTHIHSGKNHFFNVKSKNEEHTVKINISCDCKYMGIKGIANNKICSHILAVLNYIQEKGNIKLNYEENIKQARINSCLQLVRSSNVLINEIRSSEGEGIEHINKKKEICNQQQINQTKYQ